jgi:2-(1,2-epoxy-1,2-dihydrophenyl)acetyl-CoA isomerase
MSKTETAADRDTLSYRVLGPVAELRLCAKPLFMAADIATKDRLLGYLDEAAADPAVKALVVRNYPDENEATEFAGFYKAMLDPDVDKYKLMKVLNAFDQFILKLAGLPKVVVHADAGRVMTQFLCVSLACDYRIVSEDTVFEKAYHAVGIVPKGGGPFFMARMLGRDQAFRTLLYKEALPAEEALDLGLVDKVVPGERLDETAREIAERLSDHPNDFAAALKRLLNHDLIGLRDYLTQENNEILRMWNSPAFRERLMKL